MNFSISSPCWDAEATLPCYVSDVDGLANHVDQQRNHHSPCSVTGLPKSDVRKVHQISLRFDVGMNALQRCT